MSRTVRRCAIRLILLFILSLSLLTARRGVCAADAFAYAVNTAGDLYLVNLTTGAKALCGNTGQFLEGLALSPDGGLFGTSDVGELFAINPATAASRSIGFTGKGDIEGLDFQGDTLLGVDLTLRDTDPFALFSIHTATAAATDINTINSILSLPGGFTTSGAVRSLAVLDSRTLFVWVDSSPSSKTLLRVDDYALPSYAITPIFTRVNTPTDNILISAMDFGTDGNLYALGDRGQILLIDPLAKTVTTIGNTGGDFWLDMTAVGTGVHPTVPEPGAWTWFAASGAGLFGLALFRARRRAADGRG